MFCQKCGTKGIEGGFCQKCGNKLIGGEEPQQIIYQQPQCQQQPTYQQYQYQQQPTYQQTQYHQHHVYEQPHSDFSEYCEYYQKAFKRIERGESGGFNWAAFWFGSFWAMFKGAWLSAIVSGALVCFTAGLSLIIFWIVYGFRANYIMYNLKVKNKQIIF